MQGRNKRGKRVDRTRRRERRRRQGGCVRRGAASSSLPPWASPVADGHHGLQEVDELHGMCAVGKVKVNTLRGRAVGRGCVRLGHQAGVLIWSGSNISPIHNT